jgi:hypothetical protein
MDSTIPERKRGRTKYAGEGVTKTVDAVCWVKRAVRKHAKMLSLLSGIRKLGGLDYCSDVDEACGTGGRLWGAIGEAAGHWSTRSSLLGVVHLLHVELYIDQILPKSTFHKALKIAWSSQGLL